LGGLGLRLAITDAVGAVLRWDFRYRRTDYAGGTLLDPTITEATLSAFDHGLFAGVSFSL